MARQIDPAVQDLAELERGIVERHARRDELGELIDDEAALT